MAIFQSKHFNAVNVLCLMLLSATLVLSLVIAFKPVNAPVEYVQAQEETVAPSHDDLDHECPFEFGECDLIGCPNHLSLVQKQQLNNLRNQEALRQEAKNTGDLAFLRAQEEWKLNHLSANSIYKDYQLKIRYDIHNAKNGWLLKPYALMYNNERFVGRLELNNQCQLSKLINSDQ